MHTKNNNVITYRNQPPKGDCSTESRRERTLRIVGDAKDTPRVRSTSRRRANDDAEFVYPEAITYPVAGDYVVTKVPRRLLVPEVPLHLLTIPGALGQAVDHYNHCSIRTQPQFAVQAALSLGSVACARYWSTDRDNLTSLYLVSLGKTGSGKEYGRKFIASALKESGLSYLAGPRRYSSGAGVIGHQIKRARVVNGPKGGRPRELFVEEKYTMLPTGRT